MDITQRNFEDQLPLVKQSIETAEFISIDTEFSGKHSLYHGVIINDGTVDIGYTKGIQDRPNDFETVEERYCKIKELVEQFAMLQYGICTFHWDSVNKKYQARPFNFYIFKQGTKCYDTMLFQVSQTRQK